MTPVDLLEYAQFREKISPRRLSCEGLPRTVTRYQLVLSHVIDLLVILCATSMVLVFMELSMNQFLVTPRLRGSLGISAGPFWSIFPMTFTAYFFAAFYFNYGQTYGSYRLKYRTELNPWQAPATFRWIAFTALNYLSLGFAAKKWGWNKAYQQHDYLYQQLLQVTAPAPMDLLWEIQQRADVAAIEEAA